MNEPCDCCRQARENEHFRTYSLGCIWCGARCYQGLKTWPPGRIISDGSQSRRETKAERREWREKVVSDWVEFGHDRAALLKIGNAAVVPFESVERRKPKGKR